LEFDEIKNKIRGKLRNENFEEELEKFELPLSPSRENNNLKNIHLNTEMNRGTF
jgi:hypothetical protein